MPTLMFSISGIRGIVGDGLDPSELVRYTSAYADFIGSGKIVIGRDSRISGEMVRQITSGTLMAKGMDVIDIGVCPTPTVQYNVRKFNAAGGIALSASHNPNEWNALKLLNGTGQFMSPAEHSEYRKLVEKNDSHWRAWNAIGTYAYHPEGLKNHKDDVLKLPFLDIEGIRKRAFRVVLDCVNGAGAWIMPELLKDLGCEVIEMDCEKSGIFPRLPEPLPENLTETMKRVKEEGADFGLVVDPDVDRMVLITDTGEPLGEEYTITQAVRFILGKEKGNVTINLSTTRAVEDIAESFGCKTYRSPVGEANVVQKMKETESVIGGEGSGGVIYPGLHYGRDALVGTVITLQHLLEFGGTMSELKAELPQYEIVKKKIKIGAADPEKILDDLTAEYAESKISTADGLRIDFPDYWVHLRKSNTEPIIRIIAEARDSSEAEERCGEFYRKISEKLGD